MRRRELRSAAQALAQDAAYRWLPRARGEGCVVIVAEVAGGEAAGRRLARRATLSYAGAALGPEEQEEMLEEAFQEAVISQLRRPQL